MSRAFITTAPAPSSRVAPPSPSSDRATTSRARRASASASRITTTTMASASTPPGAAPPASSSYSGHVPGFRARVAECNEITPADVATYTPLVVAGVEVGLMQRAFADALVAHGDGVFAMEEGKGVGGERSTLVPIRPRSRGERRSLRTSPFSTPPDEDASSPSSSSSRSIVTLDADATMTADARTAVVAPVMTSLRDAGVIEGWRDEMFPVNAGYGSENLLLVERAAASLLGIRAYGVHVNGYVVMPDGSKELWVARRAKNKQTFPGKLDHVVAGGLPANMPPGTCVVKECEEEASMPPELAKNAKPVGVVTYNQNYNGCCKRDVLFCYDVELPEDFVPVPADGEVEGFERYTMERAMRTISQTTEFKTNCCVVIIDFFVRHGFVAPEEPGYAELVKSLRS